MTGDVMERTETARPLALVDDSMALGLTRAEIDMQIATARRYPRSVSLVVSNIKSLATISEAVAHTMIYSLPRGKDDKGGVKYIEGPSVRLAEVIAQCWGNNRVAARVSMVNRDEGYVEAMGIYHDLETNAAVCTSVRRRILDRNGNLYNSDMIVMTGNAACSIARRNAILGGIPRAVWAEALAAADAVCSGTADTLSKNRDDALQAFKLDYDVPAEKVFKALGIGGADDIGLRHIKVLRGMYAAIKNEEATVSEMFDAPANAAAAQEHKAVTSPLSDKAPPEPGTLAYVAADAAQYVQHATVWIANAVDGAGARQRWKSERGMRTKCDVTPEQREPLEAALDQKFPPTVKGKQG